MAVRQRLNDSTIHGSPMLYFDHNATTPLAPEAREAWLEASLKFPGNPSSPHRVGSRAEAALDQARATVAELIGCSALDLVWTGGASEAANMVIHHFARLNPTGEAWVSAIEHPCVLEPARFYFGDRLRIIPASPHGVVDVGWLTTRLRQSRPSFVAVMAANNEIGAVQPWREALAVCREAGVPLVCDAVQWLGKLPGGQVGECDFAIGSAHKFGGPKGVGFLKCQEGELIEPLIRGGPQEDRRRAGTENVAGAVAAAAALGACSRRAELAPERALWRDEFEQQLKARLPGARVFGEAQPRLWNTSAVMMPETADCRQRWVVKLDRLGCAVSTGSACSSGKEAPSHVLMAMGVPPSDAGRVLRFSSGWETTRDDWGKLLEFLVEAHSALSKERAAA